MIKLNLMNDLLSDTSGKRDSKNLEGSKFEPVFRYHPKTKVGKEVQANKYESVYQLVEATRIIEPLILDFFKQKLITKVVSVSRISHTLKSGKVYQFRVVMLVGNKKGLIGVGVAKAISKINAIKKAQLEARKNLVSLRPLVVNQDFTKIFPVKTSTHKFGATKVTIGPLTGGSITASKNGNLYCELSGLSNVKICVGTKKRDRKGKVGSAMNYFKALHQAVKKQI